MRCCLQVFALSMTKKSHHLCPIVFSQAFRFPIEDRHVHEPRNPNEDSGRLQRHLLATKYMHNIPAFVLCSFLFLAGLYLTWKESKDSGARFSFLIGAPLRTQLDFLPL
ncbi:hypothetical protein CPC08DRAFT_158651 [Agrocybe pediades]|nr:hypothetical protein CPC08DRAFT_158651 [Agrocybe pediades]